MENLRSRFAITRPSTRGIDVERGKMPQVKNYTGILDRFWRIRSPVNQKKNMDGTKRSVKRWTSWPKKSTLTHSPGPIFCAIHKIGVSSLTTRDPTNWWLPDPTIAQQFNWKIICRKQKILRFAHSGARVDKKIGNFKHLLQAGGRLINWTGKNINCVAGERYGAAIWFFFHFSICHR